MGSCCSVTLQLQCDDLLSRCTDCTIGRATYLCMMEENMKDLRSAFEDLQASVNEVKARVEMDELHGLKRLDQVQTWMLRVEEVKLKVNALVTASDQEIQRLCFGGCCSHNCKSGHKFGKQVAAELKKVNDLKMKADFKEVAAIQALALATGNRRQTQSPMGMQSMFDIVWSQLGEEGVGMVGLYGMGGVGKTTLLREIHDKYQVAPNDYDLIMWIHVSRNPRIEDIQNEIGRTFTHFDNDTWRNRDSRVKADDILRVLTRYKFVLLLDDLWEGVDLEKVGIPFPDAIIYRSKLVFTTRNEEVCSQMKVHRKNKVKCMEWEEAWNLFKTNVNIGEDVLGLDPEIPELAEIVAKKCAGLPLALKVVGRTMSLKKTTREWNYAIQVLRRCASEFEGMNEVFPLLKFSYDNLSSSKVKSCFLYCALFPEKFVIHKDDLIYKWIADNEMMNEYADIEEALNQGYDIIGTLVNACLLDDIKGNVKMHDMIREMALWLACELEETKDNFLVQSGSRLTAVPDVEKWVAAKRMSLMSNDIENLGEAPSCSNLLSLFLSSNRLKSISEDFFRSMGNLRVLDLSRNNGITDLPSGISALVSLQYLDLSETSIRALPIEMKALVKLIYLNLEFTTELVVIPQNLISSFSKLRVLRLYNCGSCNSVLVGVNEHLGQELQCLMHLEMLTFTIQNPSTFKKFLTYKKLLSCTKFLCFEGLNILDISSLIHMELKSLIINSCDSLECCNLKVQSKSFFTHLQFVDVRSCPNLTDLTWLIFAHKLKTLSVGSCSNLEVLIRHEKLGELVTRLEDLNPFANVDEMILTDLPELESIYGGRTLPFPYLKRIKVLNCQKLKRLPLNFSSVPRRNIIITGKEDWWSLLDWEDEDTRNVFLPCFRPYIDTSYLL